MTKLTRVDSLKEIEEGWQALLPLGALDTVFVTPQWESTWWEEFGAGADMLLLCLARGKEIDAIAPLMRRNGKITLMGDKDLYDYNDFLVSSGAEETFYAALLDELQEETWETIELFPLAADSPTMSLIPDLARERGYSVEICEEDVSPGVGLPGSWVEYLEGLTKKDRHELRRKLRRLSAAADYRWYACSEPQEVVGALDDFLTLMRQSRQEKDHFMTPDREQFFRKAMAITGSMGIVRLFFMEIAGRRVASALCFDYGSSRMLYNSGFNPEYGYYSVGLLLKALCLKDAIEEGCGYFDFLRGNEAYKYDLGGEDKVLYRMVVKRS